MSITRAVVACTVLGFCAAAAPVVTSTGAQAYAQGSKRIDCNINLDNKDKHGEYRGFAMSLQYVNTGHAPGRGFVGDLVDRTLAQPLGPEAEIWPRKKAHTLSRSDLVKGRVVAVVQVGSPQLVPEVLKLPAGGRSWIAVCMPNESATTGKALIIPANLSLDMRTLTVEIVELPNATKSKKHAHAVFQGGDTTICVTCRKYSWCHIE